MKLITIALPKYTGTVFGLCCENSLWRNALGESQQQEDPGSIPPSLIFVNFSKIIIFIFLTYLDIFFRHKYDLKKALCHFLVSKSIK